MADNDQDLVSNIVVTGADTGTKAIQDFADKGSAAFDKLNKSASTAAAGVSAAGDKMAAGAQKANTALGGIGNNSSKVSQFTGQLKTLQDAVSDVTDLFPQLAQAVGRFTQRIALSGAAAVAAGVGLANAARNVAKAYGSQTDAASDLVKAQTAANDRMAQAEIATINLQSSQRKLFTDLQSGRISYDQYRTSLVQLNQDYTEQQRVANEVANVQDRVREANDRLQKQLADRKAYEQLINTFGGPLTSALANFGNQVEQVRTSFLGSFGPAAANLVNLISQTVSKNSAAINQFFDQASTKINQLINTQGPQLQKFFETLGSAAASVFNGLIAAAPAVIDFVNNKLAPAISKVVTILTSISDTINKVFGTNITPGSLIIVTLLAQMTGSIRLLITLLRLFGAVGKASTKVVGEGFILLSTLFGGGKTTAQVVKFGTAIATSGGLLKTFFSIIRTGLPLLVTLGEVIAVALGVSFGTAIAIIAAVSAALYILFTQVDWKAWGAAASTAISDIVNFLQRLVAGAQNIASAISGFFSNMWEGVQAAASTAVQFIIDTWNALIAFFQSIPETIGTIFTTLWTLIQNAATVAVQAIQAAWNGLVAFFQGLPASIGAFFQGLWATITTAAQAAVTFITTAWNSLVAFFQSLPATLQSIWDAVTQAITDAFNAAVAAIKQTFIDLAAAAKSYLQPILDLISAIGDGIAAVGGFAGGGGVAFADGGGVHGPGTGTSDSIPAWLSNGEYVMKAKAVAKYGTSFMNRVNSGTLSFSRFAEGGLASIMPVSPLPAADLAGAGPASMSTLNLSLFGETFEGLLMPDDVAGRLTKFAVQKQNRSAGRKPGWVSNRRN